MRKSIEVLSRSGSLGAAAVATAAALVLAGCGNSSGNSDNAADQESTSNSAAPSSSASASGSSGPTTSAPSSSAPSSSESGSSPSPSQAPPASSGPSRSSGSDHSAPGTTDIRCHTGDLRVTFKPQDAAAGNRYATLVLTNASGKACRIFGYGGIKLGGSHAVPSSQHRDPGTPPQLISIPAGGHAYSTLHWGAVEGTGDSQGGQCQPTPSYLLVTPPDETTSLRIGWNYGPVCERGSIDQAAYRAGVGPGRAGD